MRLHGSATFHCKIKIELKRKYLKFLQANSFFFFFMYIFNSCIVQRQNVIYIWTGAFFAKKQRKIIRLKNYDHRLPYSFVLNGSLSWKWHFLMPKNLSLFWMCADSFCNVYDVSVYVKFIKSSFWIFFKTFIQGFADLISIFIELEKIEKNF